MTDPTSNIRAAVSGLLPKQCDFVFDDVTPDLMYSGAYGAGKSRALCYRALRKAQDPRAKVGFTRKRMTDLRRTTMETMLKPSGDLPPVIPPGSYHQVKRPGDEKLILHHGGQIVFFGCDDPMSFGSLELSDCCIDEVAELDEAEWTQLSGRTRITYVGKNGKRNVPSVAGATNPEGPGHFLYRMFFERADGRVRRLIETATCDNFHLDDTYFSRLGQMEGVARQRYLYGKWVAAEGLIYPMFARWIHECHDAGPWLHYVGGVDFGFRNPMVLRVHGVDGDGRSHVVASWYERDVTSDDFIEWCKTAEQQWSPISFVVDRSAPELIERMRLANLDARAAIGEGKMGEVMYGIGVVRNRLMTAADNRPRLTMEPGLPGNHEYLVYQYDPNALKETPKKENDHACDADRYASVFIHRGMGGPMDLVTAERGVRRGPGSNDWMHDAKDPMTNEVLWASMGERW